MNIPKFERPADEAVVSELLGKIADGEVACALRSIDSLWPAADGRGLSPEAFHYVAGVVEAAHDKPEILEQFRTVRIELERVAVGQ
ncbi:MAG: hypothetical protein WC897_05770 [Candidatus Gracilibacteria bacterium]